MGGFVYPVKAMWVTFRTRCKAVLTFISAFSYKPIDTDILIYSDLTETLRGSLRFISPGSLL